MNPDIVINHRNNLVQIEQSEREHDTESTNINLKHIRSHQIKSLTTNSYPVTKTYYSTREDRKQFPISKQRFIQKSEDNIQDCK